MAIPNGTKFHGVAPQVDTKNRGSAQLNSLRDVYTFPDDFASGGYSYSGIIINIGAGSTSPFNGDTVEWGGITSPTSQCSVLMFPEQVLITSVFFKMTASNAPTVDLDYVFNLYTSADLNADPMNAATWTQLGSLVIVDDSNKNIGIGTTEGSVGIGTTNPSSSYKLDVAGDINSRTEVRVKNVGVSTGVFIQNNGTPAGIATTLNFNNNITATVGATGITVVNASGGGGGGGGGASLDDVVALAIALG